MIIITEIFIARTQKDGKYTWLCEIITRQKTCLKCTTERDLRDYHILLKKEYEIILGRKDIGLTLNYIEI